MQAFTTLKAIAAPLDLINIDTDMIIPKQFLKTIKRTGLGVHLFDEMRFTQDGQEIADFVLNREPFRQSGILVAGENFGCGSSREHAPWALLDFGIRCVIAPSFADIFYNNCFKNGILPIRLEAAGVDMLMEDAKSSDPRLTIDLPSQRILRQNGEAIGFEIDAFRKTCLLQGLDDIGLTLAAEEEISQFEQKQEQQAPWLYHADARLAS